MTLFLGPLEGLGRKNRDCFWALKWQRAKKVPFGPQKSRDFQGLPLPMARVMDLPY
jgi:hypothetical protein